MNQYKHLFNLCDRWRIFMLITIVALQAYELSVLTGTQVLLLVVSETGLVYTFTTPKLQPLVTKAEGKNLIQVSRPPIY